ncbi:unnamed protein product [Durusdinium trenchii]|uniref:Uncharacterized protein n=1 Tax=Durusdinium trenchii TaxID=1381693 RepID=A0ABP0H7F8_9DINO
MRAPVEMFNGKMKFPTLSKGMVDELQKAGVYEVDHAHEEKTVIPSVADYLKDLCAPPPPEVPRPAIRVVVFGAPRVGKSTVTKILADYLEVSYEEDDGPRRLRTVQGCWPLSGTPLVEVLLWDTAQDLPDLITDSRAATFAVAVVDGADGSGSAIAAAMAQGCVSDEAQSTAPRRALIVENCFPERDLDETETNTTGRSSTHPLLQTIQCNVLDEEGQNSLKKVFGKIMAEMVGQIEARQEASKSVEKPLQPCGQAGIQVLARDSSLPCSARKPLGRRAHAYRLRGLSMCVDPVAASMAWQALQAARSTLPHEVQNLTGSSPPSSSWRSALVAPEPLQQTLQMGEAGVSGENLSATLRRALLELSLICPVQAGKDASVLVPDFAERINISASMVRQLLDSPKSIFLRLVWSREKHSARAPPSLRRTLRKFFSLTSRPFVLRYFARLDGQSAFPPEIGANSPSPECTECSVMRGAQRVGLDSDLEPGFILAFDSSVDSPAHLDQTGHSSVPGLADLLAAPALGLTFLLVMAGPNDTWDVLSSGPKATWAWRAFASHLPKFTGLVPAAAARGTRRAAEDAARRTPAPRWALRVQSGAAAGAALSLEELATTAWLLAGPQSKDVRDSHLADLGRSHNRARVPGEWARGEHERAEESEDEVERKAGEEEVHQDGGKSGEEATDGEEESNNAEDGEEESNSGEEAEDGEAESNNGEESPENYNAKIEDEEEKRGANENQPGEVPSGQGPGEASASGSEASSEEYEKEGDEGVAAKAQEASDDDDEESRESSDEGASNKGTQDLGDDDEGDGEVEYTHAAMEEVNLSVREGEESLHEDKECRTRNADVDPGDENGEETEDDCSAKDEDDEE